MKRRYLLTSLVLVAICTLAMLLRQYCMPTVRGSVVTYHLVDQYSEQEITATGRILALPGESVRFNLQNDQIYIKQGKRAYRLKENYLPAKTNTFSLAFNDGWRQLASDEMLVIKDSRQIDSMLDFVVENNIIKQSQIIETKKSGRYADTAFVKIDEPKEFAPKIEKPWMVWQTQVDDYINLKNVAIPIVKQGVIYVPQRNNTLAALEATSGKQIWQRSFPSTLNKISFEVTEQLVTVHTADKNQYKLNQLTGEIVDQQSDNSNGLDFEIEQSQMLPNAEGIKVENQINSMVLTKKDVEGKLLWQFRSDDLKYFPEYFQQYGQFLVGLGSYGGNSYEDVPLVANMYVFNAKTGELTTKVENLSYVNYEVVGNILLVFDKILEAFDTTSGKKIWSYEISGDSGSSSKPWIVDQARNLVIAADTHQLVALQIQGGDQIWQKKMENNYPHIFVKNDVLYVADLANPWLATMDVVSGNSLWFASGLGVNQPYVTDSDQVFYRVGLTAKFQFNQTFFATLDPTTHQSIPIFNHITHADNDLLIKYEEPYIFVFVDDFVTARRYQVL